MIGRDPEKEDAGKGSGAALLFGGFLYLALCWRHRTFVIDDAYISFRYARNLVEGFGLVFNPGERVEGYSNFLWVLWNAGGISLGLDPLPVARATSLAIGLGLIALMAFGLRGRRAHADGTGLGAAPYGAVLLGTCYPFAVWSVAGLETIAYAAVVFLTIMYLARAACRPGPATPVALALLAVAAMMLRPEAPMIGALPLLALVLAGSRGRRSIVVALVLAAVGFGAYTAWRVHYFGSIVPNTVSAKVGGSLFAQLHRGLVYVGGTVIGASALLLPFALVPAISILRRSRRGEVITERDVMYLLSLLWVGLQTVFCVAVGGDWMPGRRFLVPLLPSLCWCAGYGMERATLRAAIGCGPRFAVIALIAFHAMSSPIEARFEKTDGFRLLEYCRKIAGNKLLTDYSAPPEAQLRAFIPMGSSLAGCEAGIIPYRMPDVRFIDLLGLVDAELAALDGGIHEAFDPDLIYKRRPDFLLLGSVSGKDGKPEGLWHPDRELMADERFAEYEEVARWFRDVPSLIGLRSRDDGALVLYRRKDSAQP